MVKKIIGYVLSAIGVIGIGITSIPKIRDALPFPKEIASLTNNTLLIISLAIFIVGIFILTKLKRNKKEELKDVPIYHEKDVVGYRRIKGK
jgi:undecaprenyl pyrophosphate phosphatase UppP